MPIIHNYHVKIIATEAPTFFGYIISVLAMVRKNKWAVWRLVWSLQLAGNRIFLHEFSAQSTIIIVIYMKEAINAPIVESLLSNQDKIPSLL